MLPFAASLMGGGTPFGLVPQMLMGGGGDNKAALGALLGAMGGQNDQMSQAMMMGLLPGMLGDLKSKFRKRFPRDKLATGGNDFYIPELF